MNPLCKAVCFFLCLLCCFSAAFAENLAPGEVPNYIHLDDLGYPLERLCRAVGADVDYVEYKDRIEAHFNDSVLARLLEYQAENRLDLTGVFDPDTLRRILNIPDPEIGDILIWIPMHGGTKYHLSPDCSNMDEPRQMPVDCAVWFDYSSCGRCHTDQNLHRYGWHPD